jgi:predicted unusual protein kinase regulating ubiquinone biosynthesis (AarF/ABC1/UbiB family)
VLGTKATHQTDLMTIQAMRTELKEECDYTREGRAMNAFRDYLSSPLDASRFKVPWVWESSTRDVLVMERLYGIDLGENSVKNEEQSDRNKVSSSASFIDVSPQPFVDCELGPGTVPQGVV